MARAGILSLLVLLGVAFMLPLTRSTAENSRAASSHRFHRHSRAWWRRHRARLRRKREAALRRRNALQGTTPDAAATIGVETWSAPASAFYAHGGAYNDPRGLFNLTLPNGWVSQTATPGGDIKFRVFVNNQMTGQAALSLVSANSVGNSLRDDSVIMARRSNRLLGDIPLANLRRSVINKMITAGGWVVNDYEREIGGRKSFVVLAQTPASSDGRSPQQSWTFYFTAINNRVYSLALGALPQYSDQLNLESERLLSSFHARDNATLAVTPGH
jgi:hypothetical protein